MRAERKIIRRFCRGFESGVLNEKNNFIRAGGFPASGRFRARSATRYEFIAGADSFKCNGSYRSGCRSVAPASAIPHRDSEGVATTSERSAGRVGKGKPHGRVGASTKSRAISHCRRGEISRAAGSAPPRFPTEDTSVVSSASALAARCSGVSTSPILHGRFSDHRYLGRNFGTGNDLKHGCWCIVNAADHDRRRQSLHEHFTRQYVCARLFERYRSQPHRGGRP